MRKAEGVRKTKGHRWLGLSVVFPLLAVFGPVHGAGGVAPRPHQALNPGSLYQPVAFGSAPQLGTLDLTYNFPVVGMAGAPDGRGLWLVASDGGVFAFGSAVFYGSAGSSQLNQPVTGMAVTPDGRGYWLVAADGGVFTYGDATFYGSTGGSHLNASIIGIAASPDGKGYWLVGGDGGVFAFGDARFAGSTGGIALNAPIAGIAGNGAGGYWLVATDGGVFSYGGAIFHGSMAGTHLNTQIAAITGSAAGSGYWLAGADGGVFAFGDARFHGSMVNSGVQTNYPVGSIAAEPDGNGYWLLPQSTLPIVTIQGWAGIEPNVVAISGDAGDIVSDMVWSSWNNEGALGQGTWGYDDCNPDCASGTVTDYPATITFSRPSFGRFTVLTEVTTGPHGFTDSWSMPGPSLGG
jgi:hypothetical protein